MESLKTADNLYVRTPLIESLNGNQRYKILLKLENTQPSGSFKARGMTEHSKKLKGAGCRHLVSSSGGNAGLAVAYAGRKLNLPVTVFVPTFTGTATIERLRLEGADVRAEGSVWDESNEHAKKFVNENEDKHAALVHPFDHPDIWDGHASLVHEVKEQMKNRPHAIVVSVGGGGLLCGVLKGLCDVGWSDIPVVACETEGADCLNATLTAGKLVTLTKIESIAKSLGSLTVARKAFEWSSKHQIISVKVTDKEAVSACLEFSKDHKMLVEPACGASLTVMYSNRVADILLKNGISDLSRVVIVVCGGCAVTMEQLMLWKNNFSC